jgi:hypothetical protein
MNDIKETSVIVTAKDTQVIKSRSRLPVESAQTATPEHFSLPWTLDTPAKVEGNQNTEVSKQRSAVTNRKDLPRTSPTSNYLEVRQDSNLQSPDSNMSLKAAENAAIVSAGDFLGSLANVSAKFHALRGADGLDRAESNGE